MKNHYFRFFFVSALLLFGLYFFLFALFANDADNGSFSYISRSLSQNIQDPLLSEPSPDKVSPDQPGPARHEYSHYYFDGLSDTQKITYIEMYNGISSLSEEFALTPVTKDICETAFQALCADRPDLFWVASFSAKYVGDPQAPSTVVLLPGYENVKEIEQTVFALEAKRSDLLAQMNIAFSDQSNVSQQKKAQWLLQQLCNMTKYDDTASNGQQLRSALLDGHSVCAGYTRALQYLFMGAGIECSFVSGTAKEESHAWLAANIDGNWCYMDPTWSDTDCISFNGDGNDLLHREYIFITGAELALDHTPDADIWPETSDTVWIADTDNIYYTDTWQPEQLQPIFLQSAQNHSADICLCFSDETVWQQAITAMDRGDFSLLQAYAAENVFSLVNDSVLFYQNDSRRVFQIILQYQ